MSAIITRFFGTDGNEKLNIFGPGDSIDELLSESGDPRWDLWVARNNLPPPGNDIFPNNNTSVLSNNIIRANLPDMFIKPSEIDLYKAQLALEGFTAAGNADVNYKNGVKNELLWWGRDIPGAIRTLTNAQIDTYVNGLSAPTLQDVYAQQYLAAFLQPVMAWNVYRINKFPDLEAPGNTSIGTILRRFTYPSDEIGANTNTPESLSTGTPMWFEN